MSVATAADVVVANADLIAVAVEDVVAVAGAVHPAVDDGGGSGVTGRDIFAACGAGVAGRVNALYEVGAVSAGVGEVVMIPHIFAV